MKNLITIKYFFDKFKFLQVYNSPFKPLIPILYIGKINYWDKILKDKWV